MGERIEEIRERIAEIVERTADFRERTAHIRERIADTGERIGRKLIYIGAVGLIIWLVWELIFVSFPYTKESIEDMLTYINLSDKIFESNIIIIIARTINRVFCLYSAIFFLKSGNKSNFVTKIYGLFFAGFYMEFVIFSTTNTMFLAEHIVSAAIIFIGIVLLKGEWFTKGHRIENYGKAVLTISAWFMLILSGSYAKRFTTSLAMDYPQNGIQELSNLLGLDNIDLVWVLRFNIFMIFMSVLLMFGGIGILKRLREDETENMLLSIFMIGIVIILAGIYRKIQIYPVGVINRVWQKHLFLGSFLITGGILNNIGIMLRNRREIVDLQGRM